MPPMRRAWLALSIILMRCEFSPDTRGFICCSILGILFNGGKMPWLLKNQRRITLLFCANFIMAMTLWLDGAIWWHRSISFLSKIWWMRRVYWFGASRAASVVARRARAKPSCCQFSWCARLRAMPLTFVPAAIHHISRMLPAKSFIALPLEKVTYLSRQCVRTHFL